MRCLLRLGHSTVGSARSRVSVWRGTLSSPRGTLPSRRGAIVETSGHVAFDTRPIASTIVSDTLSERYGSACGPTDRVVMASDRRTLGYDRPFARSCKLSGWCDALCDVADRLIVSADQENMGAARALRASGRHGGAIGFANRASGSATQVIGSANRAIASPKQPSRSTVRNSLLRW